MLRHIEAFFQLSDWILNPLVKIFSSKCIGDTCEQCVSHYCANGGKCIQEGWQQKCKCLDDFDPATNCRFVTCAKSCQLGNTPVNISRQPGELYQCLD